MGANDSTTTTTMQRMVLKESQSPSAERPRHKRAPSNVKEVEEKDEDDDADQDTRQVVLVCYGAKGSYYLQFSDCTQAWDNIPQSLHSKLLSRKSSVMPPVSSLSISESGNWLAVFADGSFASSGFTLSSKLRDCLFAEDEAQPLLFTFAPHDGWVLVMDNGNLAYERLPSTLESLLGKRNAKMDARVCELQISGHGGWFVRFEDGECEWEGLPQVGGG